MRDVFGWLMVYGFIIAIHHKLSTIHQGVANLIVNVDKEGRADDPLKSKN